MLPQLMVVKSNFFALPVAEGDGEAGAAPAAVQQQSVNSTRGQPGATGHRGQGTRMLVEP